MKTIHIFSNLKRRPVFHDLVFSFYSIIHLQMSSFYFLNLKYNFQIQANIGVILFAVQEFDYALKFLYSAENLLSMNGEPKKLKVNLWNNIYMVMKMSCSCNQVSKFWIRYDENRVSSFRFENDTIYFVSVFV